MWFPRTGQMTDITLRGELGSEYLQSHEAGTPCHVIRLLEKDLSSLNTPDLSFPQCHGERKRQEKLVRWRKRAWMGWELEIRWHTGGGGGGGGVGDRGEKLSQSHRERENILHRVLCGVKRLTQFAQWENHVLGSYLVYDPSTEFQPCTQMHWLHFVLVSEGPSVLCFLVSTVICSAWLLLFCKVSDRKRRTLGNQTLWGVHLYKTMLWKQDVFFILNSSRVNTSRIFLSEKVVQPCENMVYQVWIFTDLKLHLL